MTTSCGLEAAYSNRCYSSSHSPSPLKTIHGNYERLVSRTYAKTLIRVKATKAKINKWGYIQLKSTTKETTNKMKRQRTE